MNTLSSPRAQQRQYSVIGFVMSLMICFSIVLPTISSLMMKILKPDYANQPWLVMIVNYGLHYLLGYPLAILWLRYITVGVPEEKKMGASGFFSALPICMLLSYIGNLLATIPNTLISMIRGQMPNNSINDMVNSMPIWVLIVFAVILGPILEELLFRKAFCDALYPFGEVTCVVMGGLIFGLIHGNFYQFFYAFLIGGLFSLIYCRTGRIRYTILLHILFNFYGTVIIPKVISLVDATALNEGNFAALFSENFWGALMYFAVILFNFTLYVVGLILLIIGRKKLRLKKSAVELHRPFIAIRNPGMIVFLIIAVIRIGIQM